MVEGALYEEDPTRTSAFSTFSYEICISAWRAKCKISAAKFNDVMRLRDAALDGRVNEVSEIAP